jgi:hypothetical protein
MLHCTIRAVPDVCFLSWLPDSTKNSPRGWRTGMGERQGVDPSRPLLITVFILPYGNTRLLLIPRFFIQAEELFLLRINFWFIFRWCEESMAGPFLADRCFFTLANAPTMPAFIDNSCIRITNTSKQHWRETELDDDKREGNGLFFQESWCFWKVVVLTAGNLTWSACFYSNTVRNTNKMHCTRLPLSSALPSILLATSTRLRQFSVLALRQLSCAERWLSPPPSCSAENKDVIY